MTDIRRTDDAPDPDRCPRDLHGIGIESFGWLRVSYSCMAATVPMQKGTGLQLRRAAQADNYV